MPAKKGASKEVQDVRTSNLLLPSAPMSSCSYLSDAIVFTQRHLIQPFFAFGPGASSIFYFGAHGSRVCCHPKFKVVFGLSDRSANAVPQTSPPCAATIFATSWGRSTPLCLSTSSSHLLFVDHQGLLYGAGQNEFGQLGTDHTSPRSATLSEAQLHCFTQIPVFASLPNVPNDSTRAYDGRGSSDTSTGHLSITTSTSRSQERFHEKQPQILSIAAGSRHSLAVIVNSSGSMSEPSTNKTHVMISGYLHGLCLTGENTVVRNNIFSGSSSYAENDVDRGCVSDTPSCFDPPQQLHLPVKVSGAGVQQMYCCRSQKREEAEDDEVLIVRNAGGDVNDSDVREDFSFHDVDDEESESNAADYDVFITAQPKCKQHAVGRECSFPVNNKQLTDDLHHCKSAQPTTSHAALIPHSVEWYRAHFGHHSGAAAACETLYQAFFPVPNPSPSSPSTGCKPVIHALRTHSSRTAADAEVPAIMFSSSDGNTTTPISVHNSDAIAHRTDARNDCAVAGGGEIGISQKGSLGIVGGAIIHGTVGCGIYGVIQANLQQPRKRKSKLLRGTMHLTAAASIGGAALDRTKTDSSVSRVSSSHHQRSFLDSGGGGSNYDLLQENTTLHQLQQQESPTMMRKNINLYALNRFLANTDVEEAALSSSHASIDVSNGVIKAAREFYESASSASSSDNLNSRHKMASERTAPHIFITNSNTGSSGNPERSHKLNGSHATSPSVLTDEHNSGSTHRGSSFKNHNAVGGIGSLRSSPSSSASPSTRNAVPRFTVIPFFQYEGITKVWATGGCSWALGRRGLWVFGTHGHISVKYPVLVHLPFPPLLPFEDYLVTAEQRLAVSNEGCTQREEHQSFMPASEVRILDVAATEETLYILAVTRKSAEFHRRRRQIVQKLPHQRQSVAQVSGATGATTLTKEQQNIETEIRFGGVRLFAHSTSPFSPL